MDIDIVQIDAKPDVSATFSCSQNHNGIDIAIMTLTNTVLRSEFPANPRDLFPERGRKTNQTP